MFFLLLEDILARLLCTTDAVTSMCIIYDSFGFPGCTDHGICLWPSVSLFNSIRSSFFETLRLAVSFL